MGGLLLRSALESQRQTATPVASDTLLAGRLSDGTSPLAFHSAVTPSLPDPVARAKTVKLSEMTRKVR
jgi:hypothetical protein